MGGGNALEAVLLRREAVVLFEGVAEDAFAGKAGAEADFLNGELRILQEIADGGHAAVDDILMGCIPCLLAEDPDEMEFGKRGRKLHAELVER